METKPQSGLPMPNPQRMERIMMGNLLDVIAVDCPSCGSAGFVFYGDEGMMVMPCECEE